MKRFNFGTLLALAAIACLAVPTVASAERFFARLIGAEEVPANTSVATGDFVFTFQLLAPTLPSQNPYSLTYSGLEGIVQQAHIHIGQPGVNGGISIWLCGTAALPGPAGTPLCPQAGTVTGQITAAKVIGPAGQRVEAGAFLEVIQALRRGIGYVNVHTSVLPGGEIRGVVR